jgi:protein-S-isoprenylcysteine O-methyltransferase Ste14
MPTETDPRRTRRSLTLGAIVFFLVAPGTVAGVIPYLLTGWQPGDPFPGRIALRAAGAILVAVGLASLAESFARFVRKGRGTPAPIVPPNELVISGQYHFFRNPMYVAVVSIILGQSLVLGRAVLLVYGAVVWALFHIWVIAYEEPRLRRQFGRSYEAYCSRVGRWLPRVGSAPAPPQGPGRSNV